MRGPPARSGRAALPRPSLTRPIALIAAVWRGRRWTGDTSADRSGARCGAERRQPRQLPSVTIFTVLTGRSAGLTTTPRPPTDPEPSQRASRDRRAPTDATSEPRKWPINERSFQTSHSEVKTDNINSRKKISRPLI